MDFVLSFCLAFSERECKRIIYYNPFRICQMFHVLCNYHTFGKLFLPNHMLGKSSSHGRETFLHKVNILFERNCELHPALKDLHVLLSSLGLILPHKPEPAHLGSRTIHPVLYKHKNSHCIRSFHITDHSADEV